MTQTVSTDSSTSATVEPNSAISTQADDTSPAGQRRSSHYRASVDVSVLVPTRNENGNVPVLTERLAQAMSGMERSWELLFVDDSDDATPHTVAGLCSRFPQISLLHRRPTERVGPCPTTERRSAAAAPSSLSSNAFPPAADARLASANRPVGSGR